MLATLAMRDPYATSLSLPTSPLEAAVLYCLKSLKKFSSPVIKRHLARFLLD
jgi:hypothetical protein